MQARHFVLPFANCSVQRNAQHRRCYRKGACWAGWLGAGLLLLSAGCRSTSATTVAASTSASDTFVADASIAKPSINEAVVSEVADSETSEISETLAANRDVFEAIATQQVIYLAETHTNEADHQSQLALIQALSDPSLPDAKPLVIGLEMFQRPFQSVLNRYLAGEISEEELVAQSEYETRWGYDWALYAPIIRYAKDNQIPLIALNTPTEVTRQVAREGLESLSGDALTHIPPIEEIDTTDPAYREAMAEFFNAHGGAGHSLDFENFFAAQVLWDETMAAAVVNALAVNPERRMIVLAGEGHIAYDYGIPNRVERRLPEVAQASVRLISADEVAEAEASETEASGAEELETEELDPKEPAFSDYVWVTE